jgi:urocanate hydratase
MGLVLSDGFVLLRKPEDLQKQIPSPCVLKKWQKNSTEIQQQMQDNIQWIKGAQENKLVVVLSEILYADAEGRVKSASF